MISCHLGSRYVKTDQLLGKESTDKLVLEIEYKFQSQDSTF